MDDTTHPLKLAVIVGSVREGRFGPVVASWFAGQAEQHNDMEVDLIDLADAPLPQVLGGKASPEVTAISARLDAADAFTVVTPEYNHSFPASLKSVIDWHYRQWQAKPVGFVSYGGLAGGLRAVEHLRPVFAELHTVTVRDTVSFHGAWGRFNDDGDPIEPEVCNAAAKTMLDQLAWWGFALRDARAAHPYGT
jgi:NAD(P)H-dependent FMN reductase